MPGKQIEASGPEPVAGPGCEPVKEQSQGRRT